jgi:hypothetical protein
MVFPLVSTGYRNLLNYLPETNGVHGSTGYGSPQTNTQYSWYGAVQGWTVTEDKKAVLVYRSDGSVASRYPSYILQGAREISASIVYYPQDSNVLIDMINNVVTTSHTLIFKHFDITTQGSGTVGLYYVKGAVANTVTIRGVIGQPLEVTIDYYAQDFFEGLPTGATFTTTDPGAIPYYFKNESLSIDGSALQRTLEFTSTITNNATRISQFGQYYIRTLPVLTARAQGDFKATFQSTDGTLNVDDLNLVLSDTDPTGLTPHSISLALSIGHTLSHSIAKLHTVNVPNKISDYIALPFNWDAQDVTVT